MFHFTWISYRICTWISSLFNAKRQYINISQTVGSTQPLYEGISTIL